MPTRRIPIFLGVQVECQTCGRSIEDPLTVEELGRYCSRRCFHAQGLPLPGRRAA